MNTIRRIEKSTFSEQTVPPAQGRSVAWQLLYGNDVHNHLGFDDATPSFPQALCQLKQDAITNTPTLTLLGGDDHAGSAWDIFFEEPDTPDPAYSLYSSLGVDAITLGNHDFDLGVDRLIEKLSQSPKLPVIASNLSLTSPLCPHTEPALIFEFKAQALSIGVMALLTTEQCSHASYLLNPIDAFESLYPTLKSQCHFVIVLSHLGYADSLHNTRANDHYLITRTKEDPNTLVCGAHTHDLFPSTDTTNTDSPPRYLQSGWNGTHIGQAHWQPNSSTFQLKNTPINTIPKTPPPPPFKSLEKAIRKAFSKREENWPSIVIKNSDELRNERMGTDAYLGESPHLNFVNDILFPLSSNQSQATLSGLCVRTLGKTPLQEKVSLKNWFHTFPYLDRPDWIDIPWKSLPAFIETNAQRLLLPPHFLPHHGWLQFDRRLRYRVKKQAAQVVLERLQYDGVFYQPDQYETLRIYSTSYFTLGYGGYDRVLKEIGITPNHSLKETNSVPWKTQLAQRLQQRSPIITPSPLIDGRIVISE